MDKNKCGNCNVSVVSSDYIINENILVKISVSKSCGEPSAKIPDII